MGYESNRPEVVMEGGVFRARNVFGFKDQLRADGWKFDAATKSWSTTDSAKAAAAREALAPGGEWNPAPRVVQARPSPSPTPAMVAPPVHRSPESPAPSAPSERFALPRRILGRDRLELVQAAWLLSLEDRRADKTRPSAEQLRIDDETMVQEERSERLRAAFSGLVRDARRAMAGPAAEDDSRTLGIWIAILWHIRDLARPGGQAAMEPGMIRASRLMGVMDPLGNAWIWVSPDRKVDGTLVHHPLRTPSEETMAVFDQGLAELVGIALERNAARPPPSPLLAAAMRAIEAKKERIRLLHGEAEMAAEPEFIEGIQRAMMKAYENSWMDRGGRAPVPVLEELPAETRPLSADQRIALERKADREHASHRIRLKGEVAILPGGEAPSPAPLMPPPAPVRRLPAPPPPVAFPR